MSAVGQAQRGRFDIVAGDALLHPVALIAIALLLVNDQVLKQLAPGVVTGKLSDFAGMVFFPLLLQAVWEVGSSVFGLRSLASQRVLALAIVATGLVFAAIQVMPAAGDAYRSVLGWLQWLVGGAPWVLFGRPIGNSQPANLTPDPTDLVALPALLVAYVIGRARARAGAREQ
jgi:hypothetical protein